MPRPKSDAGPPADARMEAALFAALRDMPFDRITVSGIVKGAGLNRNSFYYHFSDLDELARSAVRRLLIPEIPRLIASGFRPDSDEFRQLLAEAAKRESLERMLLVIGPHSTPKLRSMLQSAVTELWLESFGLTREHLGEEGCATMQFVLGGMFELLGGADAAEVLDRLDALRKLPVVQACADVMTDTFKAAASRAFEARMGR